MMSMSFARQYRTSILYNETKEIKVFIRAASFFPPSSFLPETVHDLLLLRTFYLNFSAKPIQCVRQWGATALGILHFGSHYKPSPKYSLHTKALYANIEIR